MTDLQKKLIKLLAEKEKEEEKASFGFIRINTHEEDNQYELAANPR